MPMACTCGIGGSCCMEACQLATSPTSPPPGCQRWAGCHPAACRTGWPGRRTARPCPGCTTSRCRGRRCVWQRATLQATKGAPRSALVLHGQLQPVGHSLPSVAGEGGAGYTGTGGAGGRGGCRPAVTTLCRSTVEAHAAERVKVHAVSSAACICPKRATQPSYLADGHTPHAIGFRPHVCGAVARRVHPLRCPVYPSVVDPLL